LDCLRLWFKTTQFSITSFSNIGDSYKYIITKNWNRKRNQKGQKSEKDPIIVAVKKLEPKVDLASKCYLDRNFSLPNIGNVH